MIGCNIMTRIEYDNPGQRVASIPAGPASKSAQRAPSTRYEVMLKDGALDKRYTCTSGTSLQLNPLHLIKYEQKGYQGNLRSPLPTKLGLNIYMQSNNN